MTMIAHVRHDARVPLKLGIGARTVAKLERRLHRVALTLDGALSGEAVVLPPLGDAQGWLVTSVPGAQVKRLSTPDRIALVRQRYRRRYVDLSGGFDAYLTALSANARSSLKRKAKRLADAGARVTSHQDAAAIDAFHRSARAISALTYQERLLDAGLPDDPGFVAAMRRAAGEGRVRAWLLHVGERPAAYLYCPADGDTLLYAHLGHDPAFAHLSPGTVLQYEALRALFAEGRFARFDFTEGDGQHKRQFASGSVACVDLLLLRRTAANRALVALLGGFDGAVALAKRLGAGRIARRLSR